jgi:DNA-directed RNA polymerases I, II, and III subunit RPABC1
MVYLNTIRELFDTRGYSLDSNLDFKYAQLTARKPDGGRVIVFGGFTDKVSIGHVKECIAFMTTVECTHGIVVYENNVTPMVKKLVENNGIIRLELFSVEELGFNVTKHRLVPRHERATGAETVQLKMHIDKIPFMLVSDPVARFHGFERGTLVKISRLDSTVAFRVVV